MPYLAATGIAARNEGRASEAKSVRGFSRRLEEDPWR